MSYLVKHARATRGRRMKSRPAMGAWYDGIVDVIDDIAGVPSVQTVADATGVPAAAASSLTGASLLAQVIGGVTIIQPVAFDDLWQSVGGSPTDVCVSQANANTAAFDANTSTIATSWQPSGFYTPDQLHQIVTQVMAVVTQAGADLQTAQGSWNGDPSAITNALDNVNRVLTGNGIAGAISTNGQQYLAFETQARSANANVISAPDLKAWVVNGLQTVSNAYTTIYVLACQTPTWITLIAKAAAAVAAVVSFIMGVVGVLAKIGDTILNAPNAVEAAFGTLKWFLLAGAGWWAYNTYYRKGH